MFEDVTTVTLHGALDGLAKRQRVIADNIASIETPGFLAGRVSFEDALRSLLKRPRPSRNRGRHRRASASPARNASRPSRAPSGRA